jgi:hypothetical protein
MLRSASFLVFSLLFVITSLSSCNKKCVISKETIDSGAIIENVIFHPNSGNMTPSMGGNYNINASHPYADRIEVAINGAGKAPVDYSQYSVLCYPIKTKCNASFERTVTVDAASQSVVYKIIATQCGNCEDEWLTENYVLVPAIPASYTVTYDVSVVDK